MLLLSTFVYSLSLALLLGEKCIASFNRRLYWRHFTDCLLPPDSCRSEIARAPADIAVICAEQDTVRICVHLVITGTDWLHLDDFFLSPCFDGRLKALMVRDAPNLAVISPLAFSFRRSTDLTLLEVSNTAIEAISSAWLGQSTRIVRIVGNQRLHHVMAGIPTAMLVSFGTFPRTFTMFDLRNNGFKSLSDEWRNVLDRSSVVAVSGNPFHCADVAWLIESIAHDEINACHRFANRPFFTCYAFSAEGSRNLVTNFAELRRAMPSLLPNDTWQQLGLLADHGLDFLPASMALRKQGNCRPRLEDTESQLGLRQKRCKSLRSAALNLNRKCISALMATLCTLLLAL